MLAIAINALYTTLRRRGTTRQLAGAIVTCVVSALLLLPAIVWYNLRFTVEQANLPVAEVEVALVYVALFGWFLPLGVTIAYCLFTLPRTFTSSMQIPHPKRTTRVNAATALHPPRYQPGLPAPYVYREDTPWGWLEYRSGNFQGQKLALKRSIIPIGRGEENDIWLDDEMVSRNHAELAWDKGLIYITDCDSLNGVMLKGKRIRGTDTVDPGALLEIGSHRFLFTLAEYAGTPGEQEDPLSHHIWHSAEALQTPSEKFEKLPMTQALSDGLIASTLLNQEQRQPTKPGDTPNDLEAQDTAEIDQVSSPPRPTDVPMLFIIRDGEAAGQSFVLDHAILTIGRGSECNVVINDASISRLHAQVLRQANGNYVQDLGSRNGTKVNGETLHEPRLLQAGDTVCVGSIRLEYKSLQSGPETPMPQSIIPASVVRPMTSGPVPLRLPSKPKN